MAEHEGRNEDPLTRKYHAMTLAELANYILADLAATPRERELARKIVMADQAGETRFAGG